MSATDHLSTRQWTEPIRESEARGDSRPVSHAEFQRIAGEGHALLAHMGTHQAGTRGLARRWDDVKGSAYESVQEPWGGVTVKASTGRALSTKANAYAVTVKRPGQDTVSVPIGASQEEFGAAMETARQQFHQLGHRNHHLGVFRDEDEGRIDIDPVVVVRRKDQAHAIGAATRNVGGAYHFRSGNGTWPPHVKD